MKDAVFLLIALFTVSLFGKELYYYANGEKILLQEDFSSYSLIDASKPKGASALPKNVTLLKRRGDVFIVKTDDPQALKQLKIKGSLFPAYRTKNGAKLHVSGRVFVKIPGNPDLKNAEKWCKSNGLNLIKQYKYIPRWYLVSSPENPIETAVKLVENKIAAGAEPSFFLPMKKRIYAPNDPLFKNQWSLSNDKTNLSLSGGDHAHVAEAWEVLRAFRGELGGKGVKIAIIDEGFDLKHEDLRGRFLAGYDFTDDDKTPSPGNAEMHGTSVAGIIGAATDNGKGISGVCPNCGLIPIRMDICAYSLDALAIEAFEWAADAKAQIISNSWGPEDNTGESVSMSAPLKELVKNLTTNERNGKGIVIFFAAGNGYESIETDGFASNGDVFAIGASNASGKRASYSDYGDSLDFMAPSCDYAVDGESVFDGIWTTDNSGKSGYNPGDVSLGDAAGNYANNFCGTSSACPLAAGIAGLVLSANPNLTKDEIYEIYRETSDKIGDDLYDSRGFNPNYGYGRLNACEAVKMALETAGKDVSQVVCGGQVVNPGAIEENDSDLWVDDDDDSASSARDEDSSIGDDSDDSFESEDFDDFENFDSDFGETADLENPDRGENGDENSENLNDGDAFSGSDDNKNESGGGCALISI